MWCYGGCGRGLVGVVGCGGMVGVVECGGG